MGVGIVNQGAALAGVGHPEGGHIRVFKRPDDKYEGKCPFHKDCLEGLANSRALSDRANVPADKLKDLPDDHPAFDLEAYYLGQLCSTLILILSPEVIVLGGGVLQRKSLFPKIRQYALQFINGYVTFPAAAGKQIFSGWVWNKVSNTNQTWTSTLFPPSKTPKVIPTMLVPWALWRSLGWLLSKHINDKLSRFEPREIGKHKATVLSVLASQAFLVGHNGVEATQ